MDGENRYYNKENIELWIIESKLNNINKKQNIIKKIFNIKCISYK